MTDTHRRIADLQHQVRMLQDTLANRRELIDSYRVTVENMAARIVELENQLGATTTDDTLSF